jgi:predicted PurR-regulated permease PerM
MKSPSTSAGNTATGTAVDVAIRIGAIAMLVVLCYWILAPFIAPVAWGIVLAVALRPLHLRLTAALGGRNRAAAAALAGGGLVLLLLPTLLLAASIVESARELALRIRAGTLALPAPPSRVADWPLVGKPVHDTWSLASTNLEQAVALFGPQVEGIGVWLLSTGGTVLVQVALFALSLVIAGVMLVKATPAHGITDAIARRLAGDDGPELVDLSAGTIRSVAKGVLGVAFVQALLSGIGMLIMGVPGAGIWALIVLLVAIVQLPTIVALLPAIVWAFAHAETLPAVLFAVWCVLAGSSDMILKPLLLGRGVEVPMLVILLGAIGGMLHSGIIGLFAGAVVLALGYKLFMAWLAAEA